MDTILEWVVQVLEQVGWGLNKILLAMVDALFALPVWTSSSALGVPTLRSVVEGLHGVSTWIPWNIIIDTIGSCLVVLGASMSWKMWKLIKP